MRRPVLSTLRMHSSGTGFGPAVGWGWRAFCAAIHGGHPDMIRCPMICAKTRAGFFLGDTGIGPADISPKTTGFCSFLAEFRRYDASGFDPHGRLMQV